MATTPYAGPYSPDAYASGAPSTYTDSTKSGGGIDWNALIAGGFSAIQYVPGIIGAAKGGSTSSGGAYNGGAPDTQPANSNMYLYIIGGVVGLIVIIALIVYFVNRNKSKGKNEE